MSGNQKPTVYKKNFYRKPLKRLSEYANSIL
jgi:hypothetical protein